MEATGCSRLYPLLTDTYEAPVTPDLPWDISHVYTGEEAGSWVQSETFDQLHASFFIVEMTTGNICANPDKIYNAWKIPLDFLLHNTLCIYTKKYSVYATYQES